MKVYGIPTCGTVKKARKWLDDHRVTHSFVDLRTTPPSEAQVRAWARTFGAKSLRNTSGGSYRALGAEKDAWDDDAWIRAFVADPMLIKRPVIERDGAPVIVGFNAPEAELTRRLT